jgi:hypothetical protein
MRIFSFLISTISSNQKEKKRRVDQSQLIFRSLFQYLKKEVFSPRGEFTIVDQILKKSRFQKYMGR